MTPEKKAELTARLERLTEHTIALVEFLNNERGLHVHEGLTVLLLTTAQLVGHIQHGQDEAEADKALEGFLDVIRQGARLKRSQATKLF